MSNSSDLAFAPAEAASVPGPRRLPLYIAVDVATPDADQLARSWQLVRGLLKDLADTSTDRCRIVATVLTVQDATVQWFPLSSVGDALEWLPATEELPLGGHRAMRPLFDRLDASIDSELVAGDDGEPIIALFSAETAASTQRAIADLADRLRGLLRRCKLFVLAEDCEAANDTKVSARYLSRDSAGTAALRAEIRATLAELVEHPRTVIYPRGYVAAYGVYPY